MSKSTKTKQLAKDTVLFGISTFGSKILVFLLTPLYTAVLLTGEYGIADLISTTVNLIYPVLTLAITDATLRYALDKNCSKKAVLGNSVIVTALSLLLLLAFYPLIIRINSEIAVQLSQYWGYFAATYAAYNFHLCFANYVKGVGKTKLYAIQGIVQTLTVILCNIYFLLIAKTGLHGYLLSVIIGFAVPLLLMFFAGGIYKQLFPLEVNMSLLGEMLRYSIPMIPTLLAWSINMYFNKYMLIGLLPSGEGLSESGIFSVANKIPSLLTAVLSVFTQAWQLSAISNVSDEDESAYYTQMYRSMHIVSLIGCLLIIPFSKSAAALLFDESYYSAWRHIPFLTMSAFFSCLCGFLASAFRAYKKTGQLFVSVAIGAVVNIVLGLILIQSIGVVGASVATAVSFFVTWIVRMLTIQKLVRLKTRWVQTIVTYVLTGAGCALIVFEVKGSYLYYGLLCVAVVFLNFADMKNTVLSFAGLIKKVRHSKRNTEGERP